MIRGVRTARRAVEYAGNLATAGYSGYHNLCLKFVQDCYDIPAKYPSASAAWAATIDRGAGEPPLGALLWWTGGSQGFGHVTIGTGDGFCYSSDFGAGYIGDGRIRRITPNVVHDAVPSLIYQGWSYDLEDVEVVGLTDAQMQEIRDFVKAQMNFTALTIVQALTDGTVNAVTKPIEARLINNVRAVLTKLGSGAGGAITKEDVDAVLRARFAKAGS